MKTITTDKAVLVEVPEGCTKFKVQSVDLELSKYCRLFYWTDSEYTTDWIIISPGQYEIIGLADKVSEDILDELLQDPTDDYTFTSLFRNGTLNPSTTLILKKTT